MKKLIMISVITTVTIFAQFKDGKELFDKYCSSCHKGYIPADKIKQNFFDEDNTLLKLDAPTVNMLVYAIMDGPKKIGDPSDEDMRQAEIEEYLKEMLYHPDKDASICDPTVMKYYKLKKPLKVKLSDDDIANLAEFFMNYKKQRVKNSKPIVKHLSNAYDEKKLLQDAKESGKNIIIEVSSPHCHYCKKMKREVIESDDIKDLLSKNYIFIEMNVEKEKIPFNLKKEYKHITPSFFFLDSSGKLIASYAGSWNKSDFTMILNEHKPKKD